MRRSPALETRARRDGCWCATLLVLAQAASSGCGRGDSGRDAAESSAGRSGAPNVLLISIDTLRADHLFCYGYPEDTSPAIDRLASRGVLFEQHVSSSSWTLPAHAAMFTSLPDSVHGCYETDRRLSDELTTLAERFRAADYQTAGFFAGPYLHPAFGLAQGFDDYEDCTSYRETLESEPASDWAMDPSVMRQSHADVTNPTVFEAFHRWLAEHHERPFFMFVHLWDCHFDFIPPEPYRSRFDPDYRGSVSGENFFFDPRINAALPKRDIQHLEALYDGEIAWTDAHVDKMLQALRSFGVRENTIVALTSDHGTEFFEHGRKAHRHTLYDELIHVPLIIRFPGRVPAGVRVESLSRAIDLGPTLLQLAGLPFRGFGVGRSLVPVVEGTERGPGRVAVSELFSVGHRLRALRTTDWKWLLNLNRNRSRFFDLRADPGELNPLSGERTPLGRAVSSTVPAVLKELEETRERFRAAAVDSEIPAEVRRQLESLGYVGETSDGRSEESP